VVAGGDRRVADLRRKLLGGWGEHAGGGPRRGAGPRRVEDDHAQPAPRSFEGNGQAGDPSAEHEDVRRVAHGFMRRLAGEGLM
jgi:hypothetical protein